MARESDISRLEAHILRVEGKFETHILRLENKVDAFLQEFAKYAIVTEQRFGDAKAERASNREGIDWLRNTFLHKIFIPILIAAAGSGLMGGWIIGRNHNDRTTQHQGANPSTQGQKVQTETDGRSNQ
jgi:hypothetical protein